MHHFPTDLTKILVLNISLNLKSYKTKILVKHLNYLLYLNDAQPFKRIITKILKISNLQFYKSSIVIIILQY